MKSSVRLQALELMAELRLLTGIEVTEDVRLDDVGVDSLQQYELLLELEEHGLVIEEDEVAECVTFGDWLGVIVRHLSAQ